MSLELSKHFTSKNLVLNDALESLDRESLHLVEDIAHDKTLNYGPFGVFRVKATENISRIGGTDDSPTSLNDYRCLPQAPVYDIDLPADLHMSRRPPEVLLLDWTESSWPGISHGVETQDYMEPDRSQNSFQENKAQQVLSPYEAVIEQHNSGSFPPSNSWHESVDFQLPSSSTLTTLSPPYPQILSRNARFLLFHYLSHVSHTMSPNNIDSSTLMPWKTIHLPCAMNALGELNAFGITNYAKASLLHSLLAISAFHLDAKYRSPLNTIERYQNFGTFDWEVVAQKYKQAAAMNLQKCLELEAIPDAPSAKYKEILMAVLSMVTIGVS